MRRHRPVPLRRTLPPALAMALVGLAAGALVVQQSSPADARQSAPEAPVSAPANAAAARQQALAEPGDTFKFLLLQPNSSTPVRWNPCSPITYRIAPNGLVPDDEIAEVQAAFATLGQAMGGVTFTDQGITTVVPDAIDDAWRAGADIVFAFAEAGTGEHRSALLNGWEAGRGGLAADGVRGVDGSVTDRPTHGSVVIDIEKWRVMDRHDRGVLYLHELGHAVGLDHPADTHQIMSSGVYDLPVAYQPGDLAALRLIGRTAGCTG